MSSKNETPALLISLALTLALIGGGGWWLLRTSNLDGLLNGGDRPSGGQSANLGGAANSDLTQRLSAGDRLLFPQGASPAKQAAVEAIAANEPVEAVSLLEDAVQQNRNDPEARIYLNNAQILRDARDAYAILVTVPIASDRNGSLEILRGVAQAQDEINAAGGINGNALFVWIADDANDPAIAQQIATFVTTSPSILGVVGHYASDVTLAAAPIYQSGGVVAISPVSTSVRLSNFGDHIFRTVPSDFIAARALSDYLLETLQQQRAAVFFNSESGYSQSLMSEFSSAISLGGGQVVSLVDLADGGFSAQASVNDAAQKGATALVLLPNTGRLDEALQVVQLGQGRFSLLAGDDVYTSKTLEVGGSAATDMVVAVPWHILAHEGSPFVAASRQFWGGDVSWRTVTAYDATRALIHSLESAPEKPSDETYEASRRAVQQSLRSSTFEVMGATEPVQFLPSGDRNQRVQLVRVQPGSRAGFAYEFVPIR